MSCTFRLIEHSKNCENNDPPLQGFPLCWNFKMPIEKVEEEVEKQWWLNEGQKSNFFIFLQFSILNLTSLCFNIIPFLTSRIAIRRTERNLIDWFFFSIYSELLGKSARQEATRNFSPGARREILASHLREVYFWQRKSSRLTSETGLRVSPHVLPSVPLSS